MSKILYTIDMNNGFVNFGPMANPEYNKLVPEQVKLINKFINEGEYVNFILEGHDQNAREFKTYPPHCIMGTEEAELIPELKPYEKYEKANKFYKNSINGMLNPSVQEQIRRLKDLKEIVIQGVCADLCVMDFARTSARFLDEINSDARIFVVKNAIDTFHARGHDRDEWLYIAAKVMGQAGIEFVRDTEDLENVEKGYGYYKGGNYGK